MAGAPLSPAEALARIAYLLEAAGAETYRVRAFRRAAQVVGELDEVELRRLHAERRLSSLSGVGETTARAVAETLELGAPAYLRALEAELPAPLRGRPAAIRGQLLGDCHTHSDWSDGGSAVEEMARAAAALGLQYLVLTDHSPRLTVARGLSTERLRQQIEEVSRLNRQLAPFRILTGIEVDILEDGSLDQEPELLQELDLVVGSVHSKLRMERSQMTARLLAAVGNEDLDVLGHCTGRLIQGRLRPPSEFDPDAVFRACAASSTAVEINSRPERQDPPPELLKVAVACGCLVAIDTDAHAPGQLEWLRLGAAQAAAAGVADSRIINAWPAARLSEWARSRRGADPPHPRRAGEG